MAAPYENVEEPRFTVEHVDGCDVIVIPSKPQLFATLFLLFWLGGWTFWGGGALIDQWTQHQPSVLAWLVGWTLGEVFSLLTVAWMITGREILRVTPSSLEVSYRIAGWTRGKLFQAGEIRNLTFNVPIKSPEGDAITVPFFGGYRSGSVKFDYGARTIHIAGELDESEGRLLASHLREVLPPSAAPR